MTAADPADYDLLCLAHALPIEDRAVGRRWRWPDRAGSAVRAMAAAVAERGGGWLGATLDGPPPPPQFAGIMLHPLVLSQPHWNDFYLGHCAHTLRPLYHDSGETPVFLQQWRDAYRRINHLYAANAAKLARPGAAVWVHDYHLQLVPGYLRRVRPDLRIGIMLTAPFPPVERFMQQPMRQRIINGLLGADFVALPHTRAVSNFLDAAAELTDWRRGDKVMHSDGRRVDAAVVAMSVDTALIARLAADPATADRAFELRQTLGDPRTVLLSTGSAAHSDGVLERLDIFAELLAEGRLNPLDTVLVHIAAYGDEHYTDTDNRERIDRRVAQINGTFSRLGHPVIHYIRHSVEPEDLVTLYLAADVMLSLPLWHGTTLSAKEFVASRHDGTGRLLLSEFTGTAADLPHAVIVNPRDSAAVKDAICRATAASREPDKGMVAMRQQLEDEDADGRIKDFLERVTATARSTATTPRRKRS